MFKWAGLLSLLPCSAVCGGGARQGTVQLAFWTLTPLSNKLSCETGSFSDCGNPRHSTQSALSLGFLFSQPCWCGPPPHWVCQPSPCRESCLPGCPSPPLLPVWMNVSSFISLVVRLPYSLIFCQFWLFFVFKLLLSFFWLCKEAQYVYLHLHLGRKSLYLFLALLCLISNYDSRHPCLIPNLGARKHSIFHP